MNINQKTFFILIVSNVLLAAAVGVLVYQLNVMRAAIEEIEYATYDIQSEMNNLNYKLDAVESNLSDEISDIEDAVMIWSY